MAPHVRVETRKVYVSARGARLTKHAAYVGAAKTLIAKACTCEYEPADDRYPGYTSACDIHAPCCASPETCLHEHRMPRYVKLLPRLVRFLKFVDSRGAR